MRWIMAKPGRFCSYSASLALIWLGTLSVYAHTCVHDALHGKFPSPERSIPLAPKQTGLRSAFVPKPLQIETIFKPAGNENPVLVRFVKSLLGFATAWFHKAFHVKRPPDTLTVDRLCQTVALHNVDGTTRAVCAQIDQDQQCLGLQIPRRAFGEQWVCPNGQNCSQFLSDAGYPDAHLLILAGIADEDDQYCQGNTVAYANSCQFDHLDRPVLGSVIFCRQQLHPAALQDPTQLSKLQGVMVHEFSHVLGFMSTQWPYFRNPDGTPRTPRNQFGKPESEVITCPDGSQASFAPAPGTIKRSSERGMTCGHPGWPADCVSRIVTPRAQEAAAAHFGCSSIPGPELENQPTGGCRLYGSHLEQRVFMSDFMASTVVESDWTTSAVYFGIMEDSGWYLANYSMVTPLATGMGWGFKQGCDVAMNYCIDPDTKKPVSELQFCKSSPGNNLFGCSTDRKSIGVCNLKSGMGVPDAMQYFSSPDWGGAVAVADYCPLMQPWQRCSNTATVPFPGSGGSRGPHSWCTSTSLRKGQSPRDLTGECYDVVCTSSTTLELRLHDDDGLPSGFVKCDATQFTGDSMDGPSVSVTGYAGKIQCLNPTVFCQPTTRAMLSPQIPGWKPPTATPLPPAKAGSASPDEGGGDGGGGEGQGVLRPGVNDDFEDMIGLDPLEAAIVGGVAFVISGVFTLVRCLCKPKE